MTKETMIDDEQARV